MSCMISACVIGRDESQIWLDVIPNKEFFEPSVGCRKWRKVHLFSSHSCTFLKNKFKNRKALITSEVIKFTYFFKDLGIKASSIAEPKVELCYYPS